MIARQWIIEHCGAQVSSLRRASPIELLRQRLGFVFHAGELGVIDYNGGGHVNRSLLNIVLHDLVLLLLAIVARRPRHTATGSILAT
jgi:hypothetical protein